MSSFEWEILNSELIFEAKPWLSIKKETIKLPDGKVVNDFYQIEQPDYVEIVALNKAKLIQGLWHYKHGVRKEHLGLPAGYLEQGEKPLAAAQRELLEECGLCSDTWLKLGEFVLEGNRTQAKGHFYMALDCKTSSVQLPSDDMEESRMDWLSIEAWLEHIANGNVAVIGAATAILLADRELKSRGEV